MELTTTAASLMRGRGFELHTEQMLNVGNGLQLLNMKWQEPTLPAPNWQPHQNGFYVPQHTCATPTGVGSLMTVYKSHACFANTGYRGNHLLLRLGKLESVLPTHLLTVGILVIQCCRVLMHDAGGFEPGLPH